MAVSGSLAGSFSLEGEAAIECTGSIVASFASQGLVSAGVHGQIKGGFTLSAVAEVTFVCTGEISGTFSATATAVALRPAPVPGTTLHGLSATFLKAVTKEQRWKIKVEVHQAAGPFIADITQHVTAGSVTVDETAEIRRTCQLTLDGDPSLVPPQVLTNNKMSIGEMLHPAKANELWIFRGVEYPDSTTEFAQLGVFRMSKPEIVDDGQNITITINGNDRASVVARLSWQKPYTLNATTSNVLGNPGGNLAAVVQQTLQFLIGDIYPNLMYHLSSDFAFYGTNIPFTYPVTTFGASPTSNSDPMSDLITFVAAAGAELFFDVQGNVVLRPIVNPLTTTVLDSVQFVEGENCTMDQLTRTLDETTAYNGVILYCQGTGAAGPQRVAVWDTNADSPTYYKGPWGEVPYVMTTTLIPAGGDSQVVVQQKGFQMASQQLQLILGSFDSISFNTIPNPALQEGDCIQVQRDRLQVADAYVISGMTIPLDPETDMSVTCRPRIQAA